MGHMNGGSSNVGFMGAVEVESVGLGTERAILVDLVWCLEL